MDLAATAATVSDGVPILCCNEASDQVSVFITADSRNMDIDDSHHGHPLANIDVLAAGGEDVVKPLCDDFIENPVDFRASDTASFEGCAHSRDHNDVGGVLVENGHPDFGIKRGIAHIRVSDPAVPLFISGHIALLIIRACRTFRGLPAPKM